MMRDARSRILDRIRHRIKLLRSMEIPSHASQTCYFLVMAVFPVLTLLLGLLRYTSMDAEDLMDLVSGLLPDALEPYVWRLISNTYENTSRAVVSLSALLALWSASRGVYALLTGLNRVYGVEESRSWLHTRLTSVAYTFLFLLVLLLTLVLHVFGNTIIEWIRSSGDTRLFLWTDIIDVGFFVLVGAQTMLFCLMFMFFPNERNSFWQSLPGALFSSLGWMTFSSLYSVYVESFTDYLTVYGSVYVVVLAMLWLYMCVSIVFYGGAMNRALRDLHEK